MDNTGITPYRLRLFAGLVLTCIAARGQARAIAARALSLSRATYLYPPTNIVSGLFLLFYRES